MTGGRAAHARGASNPSDRTQPKIRRSSAVERSSGTDLQTLICQWLLSGAAIFSRPDLHQNSKTTIFRVLRRSKGLLAINNLSVSSQRYNARARARVFVSQQFAWSEGVGPTHGLPLAHRTTGFVKLLWWKHVQPRFMAFIAFMATSAFFGLTCKVITSSGVRQANGIRANNDITKPQNYPALPQPCRLRFRARLSLAGREQLLVRNFFADLIMVLIQQSMGCRSRSRTLNRRPTA